MHRFHPALGPTVTHSKDQQLLTISAEIHIRHAHPGLPCTPHPSPPQHTPRYEDGDQEHLLWSELRKLLHNAQKKVKLGTGADRLLQPD